MFKMVLFQPKFRKMYGTRGNLNTVIDNLSILNTFSTKYEHRNADLCEMCLSCLTVNLQVIRNLALEEDVQ